MLCQTSLTMDQDPKKVSNNGRWIKKLLYMHGTMASSLDNLERLRIVKSFLNLSGTGMGGGQALKRIPRIKFPQRHPKSSPSPSASASGTQASSSASDADLSFFSSSKASAAVGGKASLQPKRTPVSKEEIEAILLGGCF